MIKLSELLCDKQISIMSSEPSTWLTVTSNVTLDHRSPNDTSLSYPSLTTAAAGFPSPASSVSLNGPGLPANYQAALIVLYSITTLFAVVGNLIVILVLAVGRRSKNDLRFFLLNLAVADLTMAVFCMPFTFTTTMRHDWLFGAGMCTAVLFFQVLSVTASVGTSTAIAINRCVVVLNPLRPREYQRTRLVVIAIIWLVSSALSSVQLAVARTSSVEAAPGLNLTVCSEAWPAESADAWRTGYTFFVLLTTYVIPLAAIAPAYACVACRLWKRQTPGTSVRSRDLYRLQSKRRVIKMLTVMVILFAVCWLPLHVFTVVVDFVPALRNEDHSAADGVVVAVYTTVHWLAMSNSFANPVVYGFLNDNFRSDLRWMLRTYCSSQRCKATRFSDAQQENCGPSCCGCWCSSEDSFSTMSSPQSSARPSVRRAVATERQDSSARLANRLLDRLHSVEKFDEKISRNFDQQQQQQQQGFDGWNSQLNAI